MIVSAPVQACAVVHCDTLAGDSRKVLAINTTFLTVGPLHLRGPVDPRSLGRDIVRPKQKALPAFSQQSAIATLRLVGDRHRRSQGLRGSSIRRPRVGRPHPGVSWAPAS